MSYLFTSEAVSAGHPDKICDQISDTLLDLFLAADPTAHTAIEAMADGSSSPEKRSATTVRRRKKLKMPSAP